MIEQIQRRITDCKEMCCCSHFFNFNGTTQRNFQFIDILIECHSVTHGTFCIRVCLDMLWNALSAYCIPCYRHDGQLSDRNLPFHLYFLPDIVYPL